MYFLAIDATQWILPVVLLVLLVGIFVLNYFKNKGKGFSGFVNSNGYRH